MLARRPMLSFALAVMAGAVAARLYPAAAILPYGLAFFLLLAVWFVLTPPRRQPLPPDDMPEAYRPHIFPRPGFIASRGLNRFVLIAGIGLILLGIVRQETWRARLSPERLPEAVWFDAALLALSPRREHAGEDGAWRIPALLLTADGKAMGGVPVRLSGGGGPDFRRGDMVLARVRRETIPPRAYPTAFDAAFWLERDGLAATLAVARSRRTDADKPAYAVAEIDDAPLATRFRRGLDAVRAGAVALTLDYGGGSGGMLAAMLYGYRKDVAADIRDAFRRTGIGHVLAISGLHVGLIVGLLWWLSGWLGWSARRRALACLALAILYLGLTGGQVAATRATLMAAIHLIGIAFGRRADMLNSLGASAFVITLANPTAPLDVSFQLSFTAVVFIHIALRRDRDENRSGEFERRRRNARVPLWRRRLSAEALSLVRLSLSTWFGLFPIIAAVFNQANLAGLPINVVVIPLMSLVLAGGLLLPWLGWIPGVPAVLCFPANALAGLARTVDGLPMSSLPCHAPGGLWVALFYAVFFLFALGGMARTRQVKRLWRTACGVLLAASFTGMLFSMRSSPPPKGGRLAILSARGAGMAAVESEEGGLALVGSFARGGLAEAGWLRFLRRSGRVGVVAVGTNAAEDDLAALAYQYPIAAFTRLDDDAADASGGWRPVEGAPGVWYSVSRDRGGKLAWLALKTGGRIVCLAPRIASRQLTWRVEHKTPGFDAGLMLTGFTDRPALPLAAPPPGLVGVTGRADGELPKGWFRKDAYGAVVLEEGVKGFDGKEWVAIR